MSNCSWLSTIKKRITTRVNELENNTELLEDLIRQAFDEIMNYTHANSYNVSWDSCLVKCVITLYNYSGVEGSKKRSANGIDDEYESSSILSDILSKELPYYIKPIGHIYPSTRFKYPD